MDIDVIVSLPPPRCDALTPSELTRKLQWMMRPRVHGGTGEKNNARPFGVIPIMSAMSAASAAHKPRPVRPVTAQELAAAADPDAQIRIAVVCALTGLGVTTIRDRVKAGTFPAPVHFSQRLVRWRAGDVREWIHLNADPFAPK